MSNKAIPYDFARPGRLASELEHRLKRWLKAAFSLGAKKWGKSLPFAIEMSVGQLSSFPTSAALERVAENALGFRIGSRPDLGTSLVALPRPLFLGLIAGLLGETPATLPADRDLTVVEEALAEHLLQILWFPVLQEAWPDAEPMTFFLLQKEANPRYSRAFLQEQPIVVCSIQLKGPFGEQEWLWLMPQKSLAARLLSPTAPAEETATISGKPPRERLENVVRDLAMEFVVSLGALELPLSEISQLRPGDVVVLNQRCAEPLLATVDGKKKFMGWPGRNGVRQAFQIQTLLEG